jgi:hypothetical protein
MKTKIQTKIKSNKLTMKLVKQTLIVAALMMGALALVSHMPSVYAVGFLTPEDNLLGTEGDLRSLIRTVLNYFLGFLGLLTVIFIIYAGILYVTAAGNDENTTKAKGIIKNAAIGLIIILLSFALVNFVLGAFTAQ